MSPDWKDEDAIGRAWTCRRGGVRVSVTRNIYYEPTQWLLFTTWPAVGERLLTTEGGDETLPQAIAEAEAIMGKAARELARAWPEDRAIDHGDTDES